MLLYLCRKLSSRYNSLGLLAIDDYFLVLHQTNEGGELL